MSRATLAATHDARAQYLDLLATYSGHRALSEEARRDLFECIGSLIDKDFGGQIRKRYINELVVARLKKGEPE